MLARCVNTQQMGKGQVEGVEVTVLDLCVRITRSLDLGYEFVLLIVTLLEPEPAAAVVGVALYNKEGGVVRPCQRGGSATLSRGITPCVDPGPGADEWLAP